MFDIKFDSNTVTAICSLLGILGALGGWFNNLARERMPFPKYTVKSLSGFNRKENTILEVTITPVRIRYLYSIHNIISTVPIYSSIRKTMIDLDTEEIELDEPFILDEPIFVASENRVQNEEESILLYIDSSLFTHSTYKLRVHFKSEHFPFSWYKTIIL